MGGWGGVEDMCYERRRAEACVETSYMLQIVHRICQGRATHIDSQHEWRRYGRVRPNVHRPSKYSGDLLNGPPPTAQVSIRKERKLVARVEQFEREQQERTTADEMVGNSTKPAGQQQQRQQQQQQCQQQLNGLLPTAQVSIRKERKKRGVYRVGDGRKCVAEALLRAYCWRPDTASGPSTNTDVESHGYRTFIAYDTGGWDITHRTHR